MLHWIFSIGEVFLNLFPRSLPPSLVSCLDVFQKPQRNSMASPLLCPRVSSSLFLWETIAEECKPETWCLGGRSSFVFHHSLDFMPRSLSSHFVTLESHHSHSFQRQTHHNSRWRGLFLRGRNWKFPSIHHPAGFAIICMIKVSLKCCVCWLTCFNVAEISSFNCIEDSRLWRNWIVNHSRLLHTGLVASTPCFCS